MFNKILIANRGEIACRIIRTCHQMGIATVSIYSEADEHALHVELADEAIPLGASDSSESYLNISKVVNAAKTSGADAVHPGYGFLSENAEFAKQLEKEGICFIGPKAETIALLGNKLEAKKLAQDAKVPLVPGISLPTRKGKSRIDEVKSFVKKTGYPILVKAAAGGGGRGMRAVREDSELEEALSSAEREAQAFFGDGEVFIEKLVEGARHVEVQILADTHGNVFHFFDRDCSLQRNHQKVIEEAPAPGLSDSTRVSLYDCSMRLCKAANYVSAGTVEFLVDQDENFYFLEVNSRLQVEHPVTEAITGVDLVELQIRAASGEILEPYVREHRPSQPLGHAIECRICAENPEKNFQASTGRLRQFDFHFDEIGEQARLDSGFRTGDTVSHYYDSMLAKLIVHRSTRMESIEASKKILSQCSLFGVSANTGFLLDLLHTPAFAVGRMSTPLANSVLESVTKNPLRKFVVAALLLSTRLDPSTYRSCSPEKKLGVSWRLGGSDTTLHYFMIEGEKFALELSGTKRGIKIINTSEKRYGIELSIRREKMTPSLFRFQILDLQSPEGEITPSVSREGIFRVSPSIVAANGFAKTFLSSELGGFSLSEWRPTLKTDINVEEDLSLQITAPLPGKVIAVGTEEGGQVEEGQVLIVMESMKMEHPIRSDRKAMVRKLKVGVGDVVDANKVLLELDQEG